MSSKPKFDPSQPFDVAETVKPKFDPGKPFESAGGDESDGLLKTVSDVGDYIDSYVQAPIRSAVGAAQSGEDPIAAYRKQFGEDPSSSPSFKQIAQKAGVTDRPVSSFIPGAYDEGPGSKQDFWSLKLKKGGILDPSISGAAGLALDVTADPTNLIPAGKIVEGARGLLKSGAESQALKTTGAMLKDYRKILGKKKAGEIGRVMLDESVDIPKAEGLVQKEGLLKAGDTYEDVAKKSDLLKKQTGQKIGEIYSNVEKTINDPALFSKLSEPDQLKLIETSINPKELASEMKDKFKVFFKGKALGSEQTARLEKVLADLEEKGSHMTLPEAIEYKNSVDALVNHSKVTKDLPAYQQKLNDLARTLQEKITNHVDAVSQIIGGKDGKELKRLNSLYGNTAEISKISADRVSREEAKSMMGLINTGVGATGAVVGAASAQNPEDAISRGLMGAGAGVVSKYARKYGGGVSARALDAAAKSIPSLGLIKPALKTSQVTSVQNRKK